MAECSLIMYADSCIGWLRNGFNAPTATPVPTSTATPAPTPTVETNQLITTDNFEGVIFTAAGAEEMGLDLVIGQKTNGYWTPSRDNVLALEERLGPYLQQAAPQTYPGPLRELNVYRRQYVGIFWLTGSESFLLTFSATPTTPTGSMRSFLCSMGAPATSK